MLAPELTGVHFRNESNGIQSVENLANLLHKSPNLGQPICIDV
jgi:hypothetical protein